MTTKTATALLLPALTFFAGCNWLEFPAYVLFGQPGTKVPAQYTGLESATTAVVVVTDPATDFDFPYARLNLALISAHQVSQKLKNTTFVDQETIDTFQNEDLDWYHLSMQQLGRKFNADRILYLDVMRFSMVEDNSIGLVRGRIIADARIYDLRADRPNDPVYQTEVSVVFPEHTPLAMSDAAHQQVFKNTMLLFADELTGRFHTHRVYDR